MRVRLTGGQYRRPPQKAAAERRVAPTPCLARACGRMNAIGDERAVVVVPKRSGRHDKLTLSAYPQEAPRADHRTNVNANAGTSATRIIPPICNITNGTIPR